MPLIGVVLFILAPDPPGMVAYNADFWVLLSIIEKDSLGRGA
jgi:hypothetical protein